MSHNGFYLFVYACALILTILCKTVMDSTVAKTYPSYRDRCMYKLYYNKIDLSYIDMANLAVVSAVVYTMLFISCVSIISCSVGIGVMFCYRRRKRNIAQIDTDVPQNVALETKVNYNNEVPAVTQKMVEIK